ncbi:MAG: alpha/beta hydrolase-fold protein [Chitinophagaceae bacterium]
MRRLILVILIYSIVPAIAAQSSIRMEINTLPVYHPANSDIYLAGSFNGWNPADEKYKLKKSEQGQYYIDLSLTEGSYEYKLTRGSWDKAECKKDGTRRENRNLKVPADTVVSLAVEEWSDRFPAGPRPGTASKQVRIIDTAFLIPQLKRTRRVWIYLPKGYEKNPSKKYPVLYMHDGQNVFDDATAYSGEWGVDEFLDSTKQKACIVVAVDHGGNKRLNEYNPYDNDRFGKGEGDEYVDFLVKTLKPYIDKRYHTLKDQHNTFIAGSSMGGLISFYAVLKYPKVFGGAGLFSASYWITGTKIFDAIKKKGKAVNTKLYFYAGKLEGDSMVPDMLKAFDSMSALSKSKMTAVIRDEGKHSEGTWRKEFPLFYKWLFK